MSSRVINLGKDFGDCKIHVNGATIQFSGSSLRLVLPQDIIHNPSTQIISSLDGKNPSPPLLADQTAIVDVSHAPIKNVPAVLALPSASNGGFQVSVEVKKEVWCMGDTLPDGWTVGPVSPTTGKVMAIAPKIDYTGFAGEALNMASQYRRSGYENARIPDRNEMREIHDCFYGMRTPCSVILFNSLCGLYLVQNGNYLAFYRVDRNAIQHFIPHSEPCSALTIQDRPDLRLA